VDMQQAVDDQDPKSKIGILTLIKSVTELKDPTSELEDPATELKDPATELEDIVNIFKNLNLNSLPGELVSNAKSSFDRVVKKLKEIYDAVYEKFAQADFKDINLVNEILTILNKTLVILELFSKIKTLTDSVQELEKRIFVIHDNFCWMKSILEEINSLNLEIQAQEGQENLKVLEEDIRNLMSVIEESKTKEEKDKLELKGLGVKKRRRIELQRQRASDPDGIERAIRTIRATSRNRRQELKTSIRAEFVKRENLVVEMVFKIVPEAQRELEIMQISFGSAKEAVVPKVQKPKGLALIW
jgi:hypothetical protein